MSAQRWLTRRFVLWALLVLIVLSGAIVFYRQKKVSADTVGVAPQIVGVGDTYVIRLTNSGVNGSKAAVLPLKQLIVDADERPDYPLVESIDWGDGSGLDYVNPYLTELPVSYLKQAGATGGSFASINWSHVYTRSGVYTLKLNYTDSSGNIASARSTVVVMNEADTGSVNYAPSILATTPDVLFKSLPYTLDLATDDYSDLGSNRTVKVDWADGSTPATATVSVNRNAATNTSFTHTYNKEGEYLVTITATDSSGLANTIKRLFIVKYPVAPLVFNDFAKENLAVVKSGNAAARVFVVNLSGGAVTEELSSNQLKPTSNAVIENYYDNLSKALYRNVRLLTFEPTSPSSSNQSAFFTMRFKGENEPATVTTSVPYTTVANGVVEVNSRFDKLANQPCSKTDISDWQQSVSHANVRLGQDINYYATNLFLGENCRLEQSFMRSSALNTVTKKFTSKNVYHFGPAATDETKLLAEFNLNVFSSTVLPISAYIGFADSTKPSARPEIGLLLAPASANSSLVKGGAFVLDSTGKAIVEGNADQINLPSNVNYQVKMTLEHKNTLKIAVRGYDGTTQTSEIGLNRDINIDSLRVTDDGDSAITPSEWGGMTLSMDNVFVTTVAASIPVTKTPDPVVTAPITPTNTVTNTNTATETKTTATVTSSSTTTTDATVTAPSTREQLASTAIQKVTDRRTAALDSYRSLKDELLAATQNYRELLKTDDKEAISLAKKEVNRLTKETRLAQERARDLAAQVRLIIYSRDRIAQLEKAIAALQSSESNLRQQLAGTRGWANRSRLAARIRSVQSQIRYDQWLISYHERRLNREATK